MSGIKIFDVSGKLIFDLKVYDRWGEIIWESHDTHAEWDGTYNGKLVNSGVYNWTAWYKEKDNDGKKVLNGYINVLR